MAGPEWLGAWSCGLENGAEAAYGAEAVTYGAPMAYAPMPGAVTYGAPGAVAYGAPVSYGASGNARSQGDLFAALDTNGDGVLTREVAWRLRLVLVR